MGWNYATDPLYRWLCAEAADLEWQYVEEEFAADLARAEATSVPVIDKAREAAAMVVHAAWLFEQR